MNNPLPPALAFLAGGMLGGIFFGGLWWTVRKAMASPRPWLWFLGSALLRMSLVVGGFYLVSSEHWQRLLACLVGFILARLVVIRLTRPSQGIASPPTSEARHAP